MFFPNPPFARVIASDVFPTLPRLRACRLLGTISMALYLIHLIVLETLQTLLSRHLTNLAAVLLLPLSHLDWLEARLVMVLASLVLATLATALAGLARAGIMKSGA